MSNQHFELLIDPHDDRPNVSVRGEGTPIPRADLRRRFSAIVLEAEGNAISAEAFESNEDFSRWAESRPYAEKVRAIEERLPEARARKDQDNEGLRRRLGIRMDRARNELEEVARESGLPLVSRELIERAVLNPDPVTGSVFHSAILWDEPGPTGSWTGGGNWRPVFGWDPDFRWFGDFNDRASHVWFGGVSAICEHIWWGGAWLWLVGVDGYPLWQIGWDNIASSAISFV